MKKIIILSLLLISIARISAQTELKLSPIGLLIPAVAISVETATSESFGLDGDLIVAEDFFGFNLSGKYYFNPKSSIDGFHIGAFIGNVGESVGVGFLAGHKIVSKKNVTFEFGLGVGRSFDGGGVGYGKLHMGYRFGKSKEVKTGTD